MTGKGGQNVGKSICILGGSFDPPTTGHLNLGKALLRLAEVDEVWLMPIYKSFDDKKLTSPDDRLEMVIRACADFGCPGLVACSYEIRNKLQLPTVKVLDRLAPYIQGPLRFCIGTDQANAITGWHEYQRLLATYSFIIINGRGGQQLDMDKWKDLPGDHILIEKPSSIPDVSSTLVRKQLSDSGISEFVTPKTLLYIKERKLYVRDKKWL